MVESIRSLSELPLDIIHRILSYLTNKEAISQVSILSKDLYSAVRTRPTLVSISEPFSWSGSKKRFNETRSRLEIDYMISALVRYHAENIALENFTLKATYPTEVIKDLCRRCVELATTRTGLRSLSLSVVYSVLPSSVFELGSLVQLSLRDCRCLKQKKELRSTPTTWWPNLKWLFLEYVYFENMEGWFENIIRSCCLIEIMEINYCPIGSLDQHGCFKVTNLQYLKQLNVRLLPGQSVELDEVPKLESVAIRMCESSSSVCRCLNFRQSECWNLKSLFLSHDVGINGNDNDCFSSVEWARHFPQLEELTMECYRNLSRINISSRSLKKIQLVRIRKLQEAHFNVPNISVFEYSNTDFVGMKTIIPKLSFAGSSKAGWISRVKLNCLYDNFTTALQLAELKELLASLKGSQTSITVNFDFQRTRRSGLSDDQMMLKTDYDSCFTSSFPLDNKLEIPEFVIQEIYLETFSVAYARLILIGVLGFCRPQIITFGALYNFQNPKKLYGLLIEMSDHYKLWEVTSVEIEILLCTRTEDNYISEIGRVFQRPDPIDNWEFLELLEADMKTMTIRFGLKWRNPGRLSNVEAECCRRNKGMAMPGLEPLTPLHFFSFLNNFIVLSFFALKCQIG